MGRVTYLIEITNEDFLDYTVGNTGLIFFSSTSN